MGFLVKFHYQEKTDGLCRVQRSTGIGLVVGLIVFMQIDAVGLGLHVVLNIECRHNVTIERDGLSIASILQRVHSSGSEMNYANSHKTRWSQSPTLDPILTYFMA